MYIYSDMPQKKLPDGGVILYDKINERTHVLNASSAKIYELCCNKSNEDIAKELLQGVDNVELNEVIEDVNASIADFVSSGIILEVK